MRDNPSAIYEERDCGNSRKLPRAATLPNGPLCYLLAAEENPSLHDLGGEKRKEKGDRDLQNSPAVSVPRELASFPILSYYRVEGIHVEFSVLES